MNAQTIIGLVLAASLLVGIIAAHWTMDQKTARLERKLNLIIEHLGIGADTDHAEVRALALEGKKIQAIKLYRERTGAGLKDARDAVEKLV